MAAMSTSTWCRSLLHQMSIFHYIVPNITAFLSYRQFTTESDFEGCQLCASNIILIIPNDPIHTDLHGISVQILPSIVHSLVGVLCLGSHLTWGETTWWPWNKCDQTLSSTASDDSAASRHVSKCLQRNPTPGRGDRLVGWSVTRHMVGLSHWVGV